MPSPSLEEILSRLNINGATQTGGSSFPNFLVATDSSGHIDSTLFSSTFTTHEVTTGGGGLGGISTAKYGEIAILDTTSAYVYAADGWKLLATNIGYDAQSAITTLGSSAIQSSGGTITGVLALNTGSNPPFTTNSTAPVANLTATNLSVGGTPRAGAYFLDAGNLTGTVDAARLTGTYNITARNATSAVLATNAVHANSAAQLDPGYVSEHAALADLATAATTATNAGNLNDGTGTFRPGSFFRNADNINAGTLPAGRINDTSHGTLGSGSTGSPAHAIATGSVPGFLSAADKAKLDTIAAYADVNVPSFTQVLIGSTTLNASASNILTLATTGSNITLTPDSATNTVTLALDTSGISHHGLTDLNNSSYDDHPQYVNAGYATSDAGRSIRATHTFTTAGAPFVIAGASKNVLVPFLNAQLLNGHPSSYFTDINNISSTNSSLVDYPTWLTGTSGVIQSMINAALSGAITLGAVTSTTLTSSNVTSQALTGGGTKIIGADNNGKLTMVGINTDILTEGTTNKFFTALKQYNGTKDILQPSANSLLTWSYNDGAQRITPVLSLSTTYVTEGTNKYLTAINLASTISSNISTILGAMSGGTATSVAIAATGNSIAERDASGNLTVAGLTASSEAVSGNATIGGTLAVTGKISSSYAVSSGDAGNTVTNKTYVDAVAAQYSHLAKYDLPELNTALLGSAGLIADKQGIGVGIGVTNSGTFYVLQNLPLANSSGTVQTGNLYLYDIASAGAPTTIPASTAQDGFINSIQFGDLLKAGNILNSPAAASIFCPTFRASEPLAHTTSGAKYTDANWRISGKTGVQVRGRTGKNYLTLLRLQGYVSKAHQWTLHYQTFNGTTYDTHYYVVQAASSAMPQPDWHFNDYYAYVDQYYAVLVAGKSQVSLDYKLRDGKFTPNINANFAGISPFSDNVVGDAKPYFNGGFINVKALSVWSNNPNEPFSPYIPDSLLTQSEGELLGGASYYPESAANDNRIYDGEDIIDAQAVPTGLSKSTDIYGFSSFTVANESTATAYEKSCVRCSGPASNKYLGINGFLRANPIVRSGVNLTPALAADQTALGGLLISDVNKRLAYPLPTSSFTLMGKSISLSGTHMSDLITAINAYTDICNTPSTASINWFSFAYNGTTDRFSLGLNCGDVNTDPAIFNDSDAVLKSLRLVFGAQSVDTAISLKSASGVNLTSATIGSLFLTTPIGIYSGTTGSFSIDGNTVTYQLADTFASLQTSLTNLGYSLTYDALANEFELSRIAGHFTDTQALIPPRAYDINGTLVTALGLEKESHGNADLPSQAVHRILPLNDGFLIAGDFKNYNGSTTAGFAKINFDGTINHILDIGLGFSKPIYSIAQTPDGGYLVAPLNGASYLGFNDQSIFKIKANGTLDSTFTLKDYPLSKDGQDRILSVIPASNGDFVVVTPRSLKSFSSTGTLRQSYTSTKSLHGAVKYKDNSTTTYFVVTSTTFSSSSAPFQFGSQEGSTQTPGGIRLCQYDQNTGNISLDPAWVPSTAAGVGAAASCAYPIIGGTTGNEYVIVGNRAGWWNTGITNESSADWSWNITKKGNLFYYSERLDFSTTTPSTFASSSTPWFINSSGSPLVAVTHSTDGSGNSTNALAVSSSSLNGSAYIEQAYNATYYQYAAAVSSTNSNPGGVLYEFDVKIKLTDNLTISGTNPYIFVQLRFTNNSTSDPGLEYAIGVQIDPRNLTTSNRAVGYPPVPQPDRVVLSNIHVSAEDGPGVGTAGQGYSIIKIVAVDCNPAYNTCVSGRIYPAYNTTWNSSSSTPCTNAGLTVYKTALRYATVWSDWGAASGSGISFDGSDGVYVATTNSLALPSGISTNSDNFKGLYKISIADATKGHAFPGFTLSPFGFSENQSHAIPFCVDSANNIYVGGPIQTITVTTGQLDLLGSPITAGTYKVKPWGLYKLTPLGAYDPNDVFNLNSNFNDKVTSVTATVGDYLIVAGSFTCYNNTAANKLIFLDTKGKPIDNIDPAARDVIEQATPPTDPELFSKLWLDTSTVPPILNVYNGANNPATGQPYGWTNLVYSNRQLAAPTFLATYGSSTPTIGLDPSSVKVNISAAYDQIAWAGNGANTNKAAVMLLVQTVTGSGSPSLTGDGNIDPSNTSYQFNPGSGGNNFISLPTTNVTQVPFTIYTQIVPTDAMKVQSTVVATTGGTTTTTAPSFVFPSQVVSHTYLINPPAAAPIVQVSGVTKTTGSIVNVSTTTTALISNTGAHPSETFYYKIMPVGTDDSTVTFSLGDSTWSTYTSGIQITHSSKLYVVGAQASLRNSTIVGGIIFNFTPVSPTYTVTVDNGTPINNKVTVSAAGTGLLYSLGSASVDPTINNFNTYPGIVKYIPLAAGSTDFFVNRGFSNDLLSSIESIAGVNSIVIKARAVTVNGTPSVVQGNDIVDIGNLLTATVQFTPSATLSSDTSSTDNNTIGKQSGGAISQQHLLYIKSNESSSNGRLAYSIASYFTGGGAISSTDTTDLAPGVYSGVVNYTSGWTIDLNSGLSSTSVTSNVIGTGAKTFTVGTGLQFVAGNAVTVYNGSLGTPGTAPTNSMTGTVTSYNSGTGSLVLNIASVTGSGTFTSWNVTSFNSIIYHGGALTQRPFDVIYYTYQNTSTTTFPSVEFFSIATNNSTSTTQPGTLESFAWTNLPPSLTAVNDSHSFNSIIGYTATANSGGTLYYTLDSSVNLLSSPSVLGTLITSGSVISVDTQAAQAYVFTTGLQEYLKIQLVEITGGSGNSLKAVTVPVTTVPNFGGSVSGYQNLYSSEKVVGSTLTPGYLTEIDITATTPSNSTIIYNANPLFTINDGTISGAMVDWSSNYTSTIPYQVNYFTSTGTVKRTLLYTGSPLGITPDSADVSTGELKMGIRLFSTGSVPSRLINYLIKFNLPPVTFTPIGSGRDYRVVLSSVLDSAVIYYTLDGSVPNTTSLLYTQGSVGIEIFADAVISAIAYPPTQGAGSAWGGASYQTYEADTGATTSTPLFKHDLSQIGLINIAFGDVAIESSRSDITLSSGSTTVNCPIGNTILNSTFNPAGLGLTTYGVGVTNAYWNIVNDRAFPNFVALRDVKGSRNANNQIEARAYMYGTVEFDVTSVIQTVGTGTLNHLFVKGIKSNTYSSGLLVPTTLVEIESLPSGKYAIFAMNLERFQAPVGTVTNLEDTNLFINNISAGGTVISNLSNTANPGFYFNGPNPYGDLKLYTDSARTPSNRTEVVGRWHVALIDKTLGVDPSPISFSIFGTNIVALQIVPVVEFLQPQVIGTSSSSGVQELNYTNLPSGKYGLMQVHGAVLIPESPGFSGEGYLMTYKGASAFVTSTPSTFTAPASGYIVLQGVPGATITATVTLSGVDQVPGGSKYGLNGYFRMNVVAGSSYTWTKVSGTNTAYALGQVSSVNINASELYRYNNGSQSSQYYSGSTTYFTHFGGAGDRLTMLYHNSSITNGDYSQNRVEIDTANFGGSIRPYIAHSAAYVTTPFGSNPNFTDSSNVVAPIFILFRQDFIDDTTTFDNYLNMPEFIPSYTSALDLQTQSNLVTLFNYPNNGTQYPIYYTKDGSLPTSSSTHYTGAFTFDPIANPSTDIVIKAVSYDVANTRYSPINTITYFLGNSLSSSASGVPIAGFNFAANMATPLDYAASMPSGGSPYANTLNKASLVRFGDTGVDATDGSRYWLTKGFTVSSDIDTAISETLSASSPYISYTSPYFQFGVTASLNATINVSGISTLLVTSEIAAIGPTVFTATNTIWVLNSQISLYESLGYVLTGNSSGIVYQMVYYGSSTQQQTAGPRHVACLFSTKSDFSTYTIISDTNLYQAGAPYTDSAGTIIGYNPIPNALVDLADDINNGLQVNPVTILPGQTGYFRLVPYNATSPSRKFGFYHNVGNTTVIPDITLYGFITTQSAVLTTSNISPDYSTISVSPVLVAADGTTEATIIITPKLYANTNAGPGYSVTVFSNTPTDLGGLDDVIKILNVDTSETLGSTTNTRSDGTARFRIRSTAGVAAHISTLSFTVDDTVGSRGTVTSNNEAVLQIGSTNSTATLSASTGDPTTTIQIDVKLVGPTGQYLSGRTMPLPSVITTTGLVASNPSAVSVAYLSGFTSTTGSSGVSVGRWSFTVTCTATGSFELSFTASDGTVINTSPITITPGAVNVSNSTFGLSTTNITAAINETIEAYVTMYDAYLNPIPGVIIQPQQPTSEVGSLTIEAYNGTAWVALSSLTPTYLLTDADGKATLNSQPFRFKTDTATAGSPAYSGFNVNYTVSGSTLNLTSPNSVTAT